MPRTHTHCAYKDAAWMQFFTAFHGAQQKTTTTMTMTTTSAMNVSYTPYKYEIKMIFLPRNCLSKMFRPPSLPLPCYFGCDSKKQFRISLCTSMCMTLMPEMFRILSFAVVECDIASATRQQYWVRDHQVMKQWKWKWMKKRTKPAETRISYLCKYVRRTKTHIWPEPLVRGYSDRERATESELEYARETLATPIQSQ